MISRADELRDATRLNRLAPRRLLIAMVLAAVVPCVAATVFAIGISTDTWPDGLLWSLYMASSSSVAAFLGLVFGVPRVRAEYVAEASERYGSNSNLEQISDWLTKLLVGAGLVELKNIGSGLRALGDYLGKGLTVPNGTAFAASAVVYGSGLGFCAAYLWTRLQLRLLLELSDKIAAEASQEEQIITALRLTNQSAEEPESEAVLKQAAESTLSSVSRLADGGRRVLWVDDNPGSNAALAEVLESLGIRVELALSTTEGLQRLKRDRYDVVISDLGRTENGEFKDMAGLELTQAIRKEGLQLPIYIYSTRRALAIAPKLKAAGVSFITNRATELLPRVVSAASAAPVTS